MSDFDYERWWLLHLRVAKGEILSDLERHKYLQGEHLLDGALETIDADTLTYLRTLRAAIKRADDLQSSLSAQSAKLDAEIAALEVNYQRLTGNTLTTEYHASS
jgi:hypothetical protein